MGGVGVVSTSSGNSGESADRASPPASPDSPDTEPGIWSVFVSPARALAGLRNRRPWLGPLVIAGAATALAQGWLVQAVGMQRVVASTLRNSGSIDTVATINSLASNAPAVLIGQALAAVLGCFLAAVAIACVLWLSAVVIGEQVAVQKPAVGCCARGLCVQCDTSMHADGNRRARRAPGAPQHQGSAGYQRRVFRWSAILRLDGIVRIA